MEERKNRLNKAALKRGQTGVDMTEKIMNGIKKVNGMRLGDSQ